MKVQELLALGVSTVYSNKIRHLNSLSSTSNVSTQMTAANLSVILVVYAIKHLLKGAFVTVSDWFYNQIQKQ